MCKRRHLGERASMSKTASSFMAASGAPCALQGPAGRSGDPPHASREVRARFRRPQAGARA
eukprot:870426-Alexandrium_andersonii.AAC.1